MKVESIIFDCPSLFRNANNLTFFTQRIIATNLEDYLLRQDVFITNNSIGETSHHMYLVAVEFNGTLYVIKKLHKLKKNISFIDKLSKILKANIVIVYVTHDDNGHIKLEIVHTSHYDDSIITEDPITDESSVSNFNF